MSDNTRTVSTGGISAPTALFITFLVLKLTGVINWSWWWVTAPLWIPLILVVGIIALFGAIYAIVKNIADRRLKRSYGWVGADAGFGKGFMKGIKKHRREKKRKKLLNKVSSILAAQKEKSNGIAPFELLDIAEPDSVTKSIRRHEEKTGKKIRISLLQRIKTWYSEGNKKAKEKKVARKLAKKKKQLKVNNMLI
jgi:hypothetical protein